MAQLLRSYNLLGFKITSATIDELLHLVSDSIAGNSSIIIASQNCHGIYKYFVDQNFRDLHNCKITYVRVDGMPIIWLGRLRGLKLSAEQRTAWIDWFMPLLELAENRKWRIFYLGARPEVLKPGLDLVKEVFPNLLITGHDGYFNASSDSEENRAIITAISEFDPHMLIVGMGMGRQERWIVENFEQLNAQCVATSGTLIEYFAKTVPTPPRWTGRFGLEWVYRLHSQSATLSLALSRRALAGDRINSDLPNPPLCSSAPRQVDMRSDILYRSQSSVPLISSRHGPRTDLSFHSVGDFGPDANRNAGTNGCNLNRVNFEEYVPALCGR